MSKRDDAAYWKQAAETNGQAIEEWKQRYYSEHQRIVDLALEHNPKLNASNEDNLPGFDKTIALFDEKQPSFTCSARGCSYFWPCPTYLWATGSSRFKVVIERVEPKALS